VIASTAVDLTTSNRLVRALTDAGVHVELSSTLHDVAATRLTVRALGRFPVIYVEPAIRDGWRAHAKRSFDVVVSAVALVMASPVLLVAALAVKLDSPGPVLFRQHRVGRDGRIFEVLKLRTMHVDAEERLAELLHLNEADGPLFKLRHDPRVTRVGRVLRTTSVDELPQLVNVLRGDMSLVGPRPALPREVAAWAPELHQRLRVLPGITGAWQVSGRSDASFDEYARLDLSYVDNWSLLTDLSILVRTVPAVLRSKGAR
jgi:exopolysaccharide biosynthesis polyprenyl glycosylphosphotransferase